MIRVLPLLLVLTISALSSSADLISDVDFLKYQALLKRSVVSASKRVNKLATENLNEKEQRQFFWQQMLSIEYYPSIQTVAELGVQSGKFSQALLGNVTTITKYYMVDPWKHLKEWNKPSNFDDAKQNEIHAEAMAAVAQYKSKTIVLRGTTLEMKEQVRDDSLDFLYIDGDHTAHGVVIDMLHWALRKSKTGSIVGGDDYIENPNIHGTRYESSAVVQTLQVFSKLLRFKVFKLPNRQFAFVRPPVTKQLFERLNMTLIEKEVHRLLSVYDDRQKQAKKRIGVLNGNIPTQGLE